MKQLKYILIAVAVIALIIALSGLLSPANGTEIRYDELYDGIINGTYTGIYFDGDFKVCVRVANSNIPASSFPTRYDHFCTIHPELKAQIADLAVQNGAIAFNNPSAGSWFWSLLPFLGGLVLVIIMFFILRNAQGGGSSAMNFGKTKARMNTNVKVRFSDVAGADEEKEELKEIVEFLKSPKKFTELGARVPKGVLLVGPPGTGKTLFAKAVAGEAGVPFFSISGSDFVEMFVGVGASRVRDMFEQAKRNMPCIIFIDEIDAVGRQRGTGLGGGHDEREQTLNQLLVQMDGFEANDGIIIMAATNRADILDPALMRPGRFDRQIYVNTPDVKGREAILKVHARNKPIDKDIDFKIIARMTSGFTGADIENLLNESAILAARENRKSITMHDILEGINKVIAGPKKTSRLVTETDKRITAYHEAGHAIIGKVLPRCDEVQEVSIIPRGMAAGYTLSRPDNDDNHVSKNKLLELITMMLGGRAAEEIVIKDVSTGASNDIQRASDIARKMVTEWGMSDTIGNFFLGGSAEIFIGRDYQAQHTYSEELGGKIDQEIKKILDECYTRAINILKENRSVLDNMVKVLFEKETIYTDEVDALMNGKSAKEVIAMTQNEESKVNKLIITEEEAQKKKEASVENPDSPSDDDDDGNDMIDALKEKRF